MHPIGVDFLFVKLAASPTPQHIFAFLGFSGRVSGMEKIFYELVATRRIKGSESYEVVETIYRGENFDDFENARTAALSNPKYDGMNLESGSWVQ